MTFGGACGQVDGGGGDGDDDAPGADGGAPAVLSRPSRSSTIALSEDGARVAMVNPDDDSLSVFRTADNVRVARVVTGDEPSGVVLAPDGKRAFVANRAEATVVEITGFDGESPVRGASVEVGSEPIGLALSPTGARLFVAEFAEGRVSVIDTATLTVIGTIEGPEHPRALLVTNDGDEDDDDENLLVPEFFGEAVPGGEATDTGRTGRVRRYALADLAPAPAITFAPIDSGFPRGGVAGAPSVMTAPNQLAALAVADGRAYVTSVSASPEAPARFDNNVFPVIYVADLASGQEIRDASGTTNLARKVYDAIPAPSPAAPRFVPGELSDIDFVPGTGVSYAVARAADLMQRVVWSDAGVEIGSTQNKQIDLAGNDGIGRCQAPTGVVVAADASVAYVNCWQTRRLGVVDLASQSLATTVESSPAAVGNAALAVQRGKRFYFTGRGRWSFAGGNGAKGGEGWSSCGSCHPDGLSDNVTWAFAAGPRQTTSQDGTFSHGAGAQKQRILNWTGIFEEHHDFERNTRDVSGGLGAITTAPTPADCNQLDKETPVALVAGGAPIGGLGKPLKELADDAAIATCGHRDWDDVEAFVKTIRPPAALRAADPAAVTRGRKVFVDGGCAKCHGGAGWTISRRFAVPTAATNTTLASTPFEVPPFFPLTWTYANGGSPRNGISGQPAIPAADATGPAEPAPIGIAQVACSLRNVGTFGVPGDAAATDALERRPANGALVRAQGRAGYNVPSLYGLALGAPYLHHGQAPTLEELFASPKWQFHTNAGNANFSVLLAADPGKLTDLVAFLRSIDASTLEIDVTTDAASGASFDACPATFP